MNSNQLGQVRNRGRMGSCIMWFLSMRVITMCQRVYRTSMIVRRCVTGRRESEFFQHKTWYPQQLLEGQSLYWTASLSGSAAATRLAPFREVVTTQNRWMHAKQPALLTMTSAYSLRSVMCLVRQSQRQIRIVSRYPSISSHFRDRRSIGSIIIQTGMHLAQNN